MGFDNSGYEICLIQFNISIQEFLSNIIVKNLILCIPDLLRIILFSDFRENIFFLTVEISPVALPSLNAEVKGTIFYLI